MIEFLPILQSTALLESIDTNGINALFSCLNAKEKHYKKGDCILAAGAKPKNIGIVLHGQLQVFKDDKDGNRTLITTLLPSDMFAEALCCAGINESPVTVIANTDSIVVSLDFNRVINVCSSQCKYHQALVRNMFKILGHKNIYLQSRLEIIRIRSVREKVIKYLNSLPRLHGQLVNTPLNRNEMADYLCVDRSALSHELMKMKKEGMIDYHKNTFKLLNV